MCGILSEKRHRHACRQHANVPVSFFPCICHTTALFLHSSSPPFWVSIYLAGWLSPSLSIVWAKQHSITSNGSYSSWNFNKNTCTAFSVRYSAPNLWIVGAKSLNIIDILLLYTF